MTRVLEVAMLMDALVLNATKADLLSFSDSIRLMRSQRSQMWDATHTPCWASNWCPSNGKDNFCWMEWVDGSEHLTLSSLNTGQKKLDINFVYPADKTAADWISQFGNFPINKNVNLFLQQSWKCVCVWHGVAHEFLLGWEADSQDTKIGRLSGLSKNLVILSFALTNLLRHFYHCCLRNTRTEWSHGIKGPLVMCAAKWTPANPKLSIDPRAATKLMLRSFSGCWRPLISSQSDSLSRRMNVWLTCTWGNFPTAWDIWNDKWTRAAKLSSRLNWLCVFSWLSRFVAESRGSPVCSGTVNNDICSSIWDWKEMQHFHFDQKLFLNGSNGDLVSLLEWWVYTKFLSVKTPLQ